MSVYDLTRPLLPPAPVPERGGFHFTMCLTMEELLTMYECLEEGGLKLGYGRQGIHLERWWEGLAYVGTPGPPCGDRENENRNAKGCKNMCNCNCCCGCGGSGGVTAPEYRDPGATGSEDLGVGFPPTDVIVPAACYHDKAANEILDRIADWCDLALEILDGAADIRDPGLKAGVDIVTAILSFGRRDTEWETIKEFSKTQVREAVTSSTAKARLVGRWTGGEKEIQNRADLYKLVAQLPTIVGVVPVATFGRWWASFANIRNLNETLAIFATECAYNVNVTTPTNVDPSTIIAEELSGDGTTVYRLYQDVDETIANQTPTGTSDQFATVPDRDGDLVATITEVRIVQPYPEGSSFGWQPKLQQGEINIGLDKGLSPNDPEFGLIQMLDRNSSAGTGANEHVGPLTQVYGDLALTPVANLIAIPETEEGPNSRGETQLDLRFITQTGAGDLSYWFGPVRLYGDTLVRVRIWTVFEAPAPLES